MRRLIGIGALSLSVAFAGTAFAGGADIYKAKCMPCHGMDGAGSAMAPAFKDNEFIKSGTLEDIASVIKNGITGADKKHKQFALDMPPQPLSDAEISEVVDYLKSLNP